MRRSHLLLIALAGILAIAALVGWTRSREGAGPTAENAALPQAETATTLQTQSQYPAPQYSTQRPSPSPQAYYSNGGAVSPSAQPSDYQNQYDDTYISDYRPVRVAGRDSVSRNFTEPNSGDRYTADSYATDRYRTDRYTANGSTGYSEPIRDHREHEGRKDVAIVGGSAAGGAAIGAVAGGGKGAAIGAVTGGVGGWIYSRFHHHRHHNHG